MTRHSDDQRLDPPVHTTSPTARILPLVADVLKESWEILPWLYWTSNYGIEPNDIDEHWRRQSDLQHTLLSHWTYIPDLRRPDSEFFQVQTDFYQFLNNEVEFLSAFQKILQAAIVDIHDEDLHYDVWGLLTHVNNALISVSDKLSLATRMFNPIPSSKATAESVDANVHHPTV